MPKFFSISSFIGNLVQDRFWQKLSLATELRPSEERFWPRGNFLKIGTRRCRCTGRGGRRPSRRSTSSVLPRSSSPGCRPCPKVETSVSGIKLPRLIQLPWSSSLKTILTRPGLTTSSSAMFSMLTPAAGFQNHYSPIFKFRTYILGFFS